MVSRYPSHETRDVVHHIDNIRHANHNRSYRW
jgi:hypothetical protein